MAKEKRLIDANALMDAFRSYMVERYDKEKCVSEENCKTCENSCLWRKIVSAAPTVDAVEVVRCKDCKHLNRGSGNPSVGHLCVYHSCSRKGHERYLYVDDIDFCSCGERREGE